MMPVISKELEEFSAMQASSPVGLNQGQRRTDEQRYFRWQRQLLIHRLEDAKRIAHWTDLRRRSHWISGPPPEGVTPV